MAEVNLVADLLIAMIEGLKPKKRIKGAYKAYENRFEHDAEELSKQFDDVMEVISRLFPSSLKGSEYSRPFLFYSLFTAVFHCRFGLKGLTVPRVPLDTDHNIAASRSKLERVEELFMVPLTDIGLLEPTEKQVPE